MRESTLRDYLYEHPEVLFEKTVIRKDRELRVDGKYVDLLFQVENIHYIVELKRDTITREAVGQIVEYYGRLRQANPLKIYRMFLVAPTIAKYRSIPLEEFGIRCVEVPFPEVRDVIGNTPLLAEANKIKLASALSRKSALDEVTAGNLESLSFNDFLPPADEISLHISHRMLHDGIPAVEAAYPDFEIMPIKMDQAKSPDVICIPTTGVAEKSQFLKGGVWWAFAFGQSEQMAKNDTPNISVIAMPGGLDFTINAELRTSQGVMLERVKSDPVLFNTLIAQHGHLRLQMWLKLNTNHGFITGFPSILWQSVFGMQNR